MDLADCVPGQKAIIGMRWLMLGLAGIECEILDTRLAPERLEDNPAYLHGMVRIRLPDEVEWPCRDPWIGPEDLGRMGGGA